MLQDTAAMATPTYELWGGIWGARQVLGGNEYLTIQNSNKK